MVGFRIHHIYVLSAGGQRVGKQIARALNSALSDAVRRGVLVEDNPLNEPGIKPRTFRVPNSPPVVLRGLGPRSLDEVPPLELADTSAGLPMNRAGTARRTCFGRPSSD